jgi:hypothetical protein
MKYHYVFTALTRISDLQVKGFDVQKIEKSKWDTGDYVVCQIIHAGSDIYKLELPTGRMRGIIGGESIVGALGERFATLEATGTWRETGDDGMMHVLTSGGLLGKLTTKSVYIHELMKIEYLGHVFRDGEKVKMADFVRPVPERVFNLPIVLFIGTSMSAGKTTSARIVTNIFKKEGFNVVGAKLTGAGRYKDILAIKDVGADAVFDFVDAGLPSTICSPELFSEKIKYLKNLIAGADADVAVIEIGASPLEPYNGELAVEAIREHIKCIILCASDPYAVLGLMKAFKIKPDIVTGICTNTLAGRNLVEKLSNVKALNLIDPENTPSLKHILNSSLGIAL